MTTIVALLLLLLAGIIAATIWTVWGIPLAILAAIATGVMIARARRKDPTVGTWERGASIEPTGTPRKSRGGVETSNQRVGQS